METMIIQSETRIKYENDNITFHESFATTPKNVGSRYCEDWEKFLNLFQLFERWRRLNSVSDQFAEHKNVLIVLRVALCAGNFLVQSTIRKLRQI